VHGKLKHRDTDSNRSTEGNKDYKCKIGRRGRDARLGNTSDGSYPENLSILASNHRPNPRRSKHGGKPAREVDMQPEEKLSGTVTVVLTLARKDSQGSSGRTVTTLLSKNTSMPSELRRGRWCVSISLTWGTKKGRRRTSRPSGLCWRAP